MGKKREVEITTSGNLDNTWCIKINGVQDRDLHYIEMEILNLFGRRKVGTGYTKERAETELREMRELPEYKKMKFLK